ncbi:hypothetical protein KCP78_20105 [Salmonella enterica subsp. enterica]|nr:hypothetical protein KCP78_20105 [Salmonella enterica subsp. enterica]
MAGRWAGYLLDVVGIDTALTRRRNGGRLPSVCGSTATRSTHCLTPAVFGQKTVWATWRYKRRQQRVSRRKKMPRWMTCWQASASETHFSDDEIIAPYDDPD